MKVVTWNLGYWDHRETHEEGWNYLLETVKPDLALLQEVRPPDFLHDWAIVFYEVRGGWGTAIYSRDLALSNIPLGEDYPGRVVGASTLLQNGERLYLASVHAQTGPVFPRLSHIMDEILGAYADQPTIVGGDLNSARLAATVWPGAGDGPFWERIDSERSSVVDCCQRINGRELQTIFKEGAKHPFQDDHLFISRSLESGLIACDVIDTEMTRRVSDHIPLSIELSPEIIPGIS